jgi:hypothetical protein
MHLIYIRVAIANETTTRLILQNKWTSGDWTPGGWEPGGEIGPLAKGQWQCESSSVLTGAEARAWYEVLVDGESVGQLYVHANSPRVESQYGNTFHVWAPKGFNAAYVDANGQGSRALLEIRFRRTRKVVVPGFKPSINGFQFRNRWNGAVPVMRLETIFNALRKKITGDLLGPLAIPDVPDMGVFPPLTESDGGMCGGMAFAAMDYFNTQQLPPLPAEKDDNGKYISPATADDSLALYIRDRLIDSFDLAGRGDRWLSYTSPFYPDGDEGLTQAVGLMKGKAWVTYREEWPRIREELDAGRLVAVGLVQADNFNIGKNHTVLAYGYRQDGQDVQLYIYDPNIPSQTHQRCPTMFSCRST